LGVIELIIIVIDNILNGVFMSEGHIRNRSRLQKKAIRRLIQRINETYSIDLDLTHSTVDSGTAGEYEILIIDNEVSGVFIDNNPFFTIRGLLRYRPKKGFVTVDMGAVKFISNGADVMAPGIVDADKDICSGDIVWIRDEKNKQPLAIGRAIMTGTQMIQSNANKAIVTIHYVGDNLWKIEI
jgi:PUA domain protein